MEVSHELIGADLTEHHLRHGQVKHPVGISRALSALRPHIDMGDMEKIAPIGQNPEHNNQIETIKMVAARKKNIRFSRVLKSLTKDRNFGINLPKKLFPRRKRKVASNVKVTNNVIKNSSEFKVEELPKKATVASISTPNVGDKPPQFAWQD
ncbi:Ammonium transporter [Carabus blaptoides fortunei]